MSFQHSLSLGAATVGAFDALPAEDRFLVSLFRGEPEVRRDGDIAHVSGQLLSLFHSHGRRPLLSHSKSCNCVGADEAVFVQFVRLAADGQREDATLMALLMIRAQVAPIAVSLAEQLGLLVRMLARVDALAVPYH
ncbi:hypothetical protein [Celeribacter marinus]|uniref:Uncharacterized protein n=1 Tax=Celeribacter marinus TaxID=1397108 RepID=A0A0P0A0J6_9RHOB|nr:hypothetical protein [Celeribacter marinus]ALI56238.1 hypothetical protein IMCC12053_2291 [Celeribacter marinus]SFK84406.1 hypothetical protein SAMN05444421_10972 [Celeribacter marinus]